MALNEKQKRRNRLILLLIIFVVLTAIAFAIFLRGESWLNEKLSALVGPNYSPAFLVLLTFIASSLLSFIPEVFGIDIRKGLFGFLGWDEEDQKNEPMPPPPIQPIVNVTIDRSALSQPEQALPPPAASPVPSGKFYPNNFLPDFKYFVGRKELLKKLEAALKKHHRASIHDISGLGKTFSAQRYAFLNQEKYQKVFFINAAKEAYLESMAEVAIMLMPELSKNEKQQEQALGLKAWLENNSGWLAIFDNVDEPVVIKHFIPSNLKGDCIFTSNFRSIENITPHRIGIEELEPESARALLYSRSLNKPESKPQFGDDAEREAFESLISEIDGLPIALAATGAIINRDQLSFADFWEMFRNADEILLAAEDEFGDYQKKSALRAFGLALDDISKDSRSDAKAVKAEKAAVREMLNAACLLFPDDIPEEFLQAFLEKNLKGFNRSDKKQWIALRNRFGNFDLFKYDPASKSFSTHRLIQKCIFSRLDEAGKIAYAEKVLNLLEDFFPKYGYTNKEQCEKYYQHTLAALENADKVGFEAGVSKSLYFRLGKYNYHLGNFASAERFHLKNLEVSRSVYGEVHAEAAQALNELALVYYSQGKYEEAIGLYKQATEIDEKTIGKEHPDYAVRLNNLGGVYYRQGNYDEAIKLHKEAKQIREKILGKAHPDYSQSLNELAVNYKAQGRYDEAIELYKESMEITGKALGKDHPEYAIRLNNLAGVYAEQGDFENAERLMKEALKIRVKVFGEIHPDTALNYWWLGDIRKNRGMYSEAIPYLEKSLAVFEAKLPPEHPRIASVKRSIEICKGKI